MGALFATMMFMWTRQDGTHAARDFARWFEAAGLRPSGVHPGTGTPIAFLFADG